MSRKDRQTIVFDNTTLNMMFSVSYYFELHDTIYFNIDVFFAK